MKIVKVVLVILVFVVNLVIAQPSWADRPKLTNSSDYQEVTQALDELLKANETTDQSGYTPEEFQQKLGELRLQKYIIETARNWGQCRNETGKTLAIYAHKPKKSFFPNSNETQLYYLADGEETDDEWSCDGVLLPTGANITGLIPGNTQLQKLAEPIALKYVTGTQLVAKTNPETGAIEFNVPPAQVFNIGEGQWQIPTVSQADIDTQTPNAPVD